MRALICFHAATLVLLTSAISAQKGVAQGIEAVPTRLMLTATADSADASTASLPQVISILPVGSDRASFRLVGVEVFQGRPNFLVVSPSSGVAPALVGVALNPNVVPYLPVMGGYVATLSFARAEQTGPPYIQVLVSLSLTAPSAPKLSAVLNSASLQAGVSPGQMMTIFGENIGAPPQTASYGGDGLYPKEFGNSIVTCNGIAAPLLYVSNSQINALVPYEVAGQTHVNIVVKHHGLESPPLSVAVTDTAPAVFTATQTGTGQGAILNSQVSWQSTYNSVENPVAQGEAITFFATGAGVWQQPFPDGSIFLRQWRPDVVPRAPLSVTIGGQPATVLYASGAPYQPVGMIQVNAIVPQGIGSGAQPVVLKIGDRDNAEQKVTVAVK